MSVLGRCNWLFCCGILLTSSLLSWRMLEIDMRMSKRSESTRWLIHPNIYLYSPRNNLLTLFLFNPCPPPLWSVRPFSVTILIILTALFLGGMKNIQQFLTIFFFLFPNNFGVGTCVNAREIFLYHGLSQFLLCTAFSFFLFLKHIPTVDVFIGFQVCASASQTTGNSLC